MGGQDLLPPAKAGGARRTSRSTPVRLTVLTSALIIACLLYTAQRTHRPDMVVVAYPVDHNHGIEALAGQHDSASPPPSLRPVTEAPAEAAAAAEAAAITVASPSIISLKLQTTSGKEHTLRLRLLPEHSAPSVEFMRCACTAHAHAPHARHTHGTRTTAHARVVCRQCGRRLAPHSSPICTGLPPPTSVGASCIARKRTFSCRLQPGYSLYHMG